MNRLSQWANDLLDHAMSCPECGHKEFTMDCTCGDDLCVCYAERAAMETDQEEDGE